jgi:hypothetical protein
MELHYSRPLKGIQNGCAPRERHSPHGHDVTIIRSLSEYDTEPKLNHIDGT